MEQVLIKSWMAGQADRKVGQVSIRPVKGFWAVSKLS